MASQVSRQSPVCKLEPTSSKYYPGHIHIHIHKEMERYVDPY